MNIFEALRVAWMTLRMHKLRSLLTMLGIIIGVASVIGQLAFGQGYGDFLDKELNKMGSAAIYVFPGGQSTKVEVNLPPQLSSEDGAALMESGAAPAVKSVAAVIDSTFIQSSGGSGLVSTGSVRGKYTIIGAEPSYFDIIFNTLGTGRFYTVDEELSGARVALLGSKVAERMFGSNAAAIGQRVAINGVNFEVIGVLTTKPNAFGGDPGKTVYVPYRTARDRLFRNRFSARVDVSQLLIQAHSRDQVKEATAQVINVLRQRHRLTYQDNDFTVLDLETLAVTLQGISLGFTAFLGIVAGLSLLIGGIGIMNIMLVSVAERTREIGLRKAVGARRWDILQQFLIEAVVLCLVGSVIGIVLGLGLASGMTLLLRTMAQDDTVQASVTLGAVLLSTGVSVGIGIFFGLYPAFYASRLNPIEALRYE